MLVSDFDYKLPPESIAQEPLPDRAASRLLHLHKERAPSPWAAGQWQDRSFREFPDLLRPDDLLVLNNTRVFPARLYGRRSGERAQPLSAHNPAARDFLRGRVEVLLTRQLGDDPNEWECLVRPGRKIGVGERLYFGGLEPGSGGFDRQVELEAEVISRGSFGERTIRFAPVEDFFARVERIGHVPLPPYIDRDQDREDQDRKDERADRVRYQTVYAKTRGSVAAPTAGLHFTPEILERIRGRGIEIVEITLHVGLGTFQPVHVERVEDHKLHREAYEISAEAAQAINKAKHDRRRVVAVGTTTVRTLEDAAGRTGVARSGLDRVGLDHVPLDRVDADDIEPALADSACKEPVAVAPGRGEAEVFIYPGYCLRVVDALLTNFHLPQSTLLMLVCALGGRELVLRAYQDAVGAGYRFYSYGDCMFVE
ncbi:MAG: S-adenosylmethionine:tRNA ribosyltransferase-isomerase [Terriglobales bacterium]